jgi:hypothetical protein
MRKQIFAALVFFTITALSGQYSGPFPRDISWMQINTDTLRLVFPIELEQQAQRIAGMIHHIAENDTLNFGKNTGKIDVFLANRISRSNGFVRYAPYHSKFFTMAPQYPFLGTIDWLDGLTIHEYRHVMQLNGGTKGITKLLKYSLGETYWAMAMNLAVPDWFFEGDAIMQETALSYSGRGRMPEFRVHYNSIRDMERPFGYEKMRCGSYRDVVPDHYSLGYELVHYGTVRYGPQLWEQCFEDAVKYKRIFYPFSRSLKAQTGYSTRRFYREAIRKDQIEALKVDSYDNSFTEDITIGKKLEFYSYPKFRNGKLYAIRSSYDEAPRIVEIDHENQYAEKKVIPVGYQFGRYDTNGRILVWSEVNNHPRRDYVSYSNIYLHDLETKKTRQLTKKQRYFSPVISPDSIHLAVNEADEYMNYAIVILDIKTGEKKLRLPNPGNYFFRETGWRDAGRLIAVGSSNNENVLMEINIADGTSEMLFNPIINAITDIYVADEKVFFTSYVAGESGVQELFYFDLNSRNIFRHDLIYKYGTNMPALSSDGQLAYCEKVFNGTSLNIRKEGWKSDFSPDNTLLNNIKMALSDDEQYIFGKARMVDFENDHNYAVTKYNNTYKMINFHSVYPLIDHPVYRLDFLSEEYLERLGVSLSPYFNANDNSYGLETRVDYGEFYPVVSVGIDNRFNRLTFVNTDSIQERIRYNTSILNTSVGLPLSYNKSNFRTIINPRIGIAARKHYGQSDRIKSDIDPQINMFFSYSRIKRRSYRSVQPTGSLLFGSAIYNIQDPGKYLGITAGLNYYLPGIAKNHGLGIRASFMYNNTNNPGSVFGNASSTYYYARGYGYREISKTAASMKLSYSLPLIYPDLALGSIAFLKRIRTNLYFDIDYLNSHTNARRKQRSAGAELMFDNVYFRTIEIPMGIGFDYKFDPGIESSYNFRFIIEF